MVLASGIPENKEFHEWLKETGPCSFCLAHEALAEENKQGELQVKHAENELLWHLMQLRSFLH